MKQDERTPGRWVLSTDESDANVLIGVDGDFADGHPFMVVAETRRHSLIGRSEAEANARFIVQAVNAYTSTEALRSFYEKTNFIRKHDGDDVPDGDFFGGGLTWGDVRALRAAYEAVFPPRDYETAWLIERSTERGPCWWGQDDGEHAWTHDHMQARRYCTKEDAEREASDMGLDDWFVCEHAWVSDKARTALPGVTATHTETE